MQTPAQQLDKRFVAFAPLANALRPEKGWIKAVREALGMTTAQLGKRLGVSQQRAAMVEKAEVDGSITLKSLEQAAQTLGCRVVIRPLPGRTPDPDLARACRSGGRSANAGCRADHAAGRSERSG